MNESLRDECQLSLNGTLQVSQSPHPIFIVSKDSLGDYWNNTVVVVDGVREYPDSVPKNGVIYYQDVKYIGLNVRKQWIGHSRKTPFDVSSVHRKTLIVVTPITKNMLESNITLVGREGMNMNLRFGKNGPYGVLLLCAMARTESLVTWPSEICQVLPTIKPNIVKPKQHFSSRGRCYAFGSAAKYGRYQLNEALTVAPFVHREKGQFDKQPLRFIEYCYLILLHSRNMKIFPHRVQQIRRRQRDRVCSRVNVEVSVTVSDESS